MGILEFGDRWDLKRKTKIEEEKNKTRERRKKNKEMNQDMAMVGSVRENE